MFGYAMRATNGKLELKLRPYESGEHKLLLPGMQSYEVLGHTSFRRAFTLSEAGGYISRLEASQIETGWAICIIQDGTEIPIGTTSLEVNPGNPKVAESGIVIYNRDWWGKGVATLAHIARTKYAFGVMGLDAITSGADQNNVGSRRALERIGYCHTGYNYHAGIINGQVVHADRFLLVNPADGPWESFWGTSEIPTSFIEARSTTQAVLSMAESQVTYP